MESNSISNWYEAEGKHTHWLQDLVGFYQFQTFAMQCGGDGGVDWGAVGGVMEEGVNSVRDGHVHWVKGGFSHHGCERV